MKVSVIMVNLNGDPFIYDCLSGLERQSFRDFETIVVDNGSTDGSVIKVKERFPTVRLVELGANKGFALACARGFSESKGEDIAVLNNDTVPEPDWLKALVTALDADPKVGAAACKVLSKKSGGIESGGIFASRNGLVSLLKPQPEDEASEIFGACGVAALYRGKMLRELGFYPDDFFIYYEDADLAYRCRRAGWKTIYCPGSVVSHLGSETTAGMGIKNYYLPRNRLRTIVRNWESRLILKNLPWLLLYECASFWAGILSEPGKALKARIDFLRNLSADLSVRARILKMTAPGFDLSPWLVRDYPGLADLWRSRR